ncbi:hypothetical protein HPP92_008634 [Vanilla planifolia]|uniref:Ribosomal protein S6 n=1 Tax=Vanilla planifolia TaxID=51239 RepID=A0A835V5K4_VANPL|nr:hypothetical protein HPP92_008634 [Vanilla planifolia]
MHEDGGGDCHCFWLPRFTPVLFLVNHLMRDVNCNDLQLEHIQKELSTNMYDEPKVENFGYLSLTTPKQEKITPHHSNNLLRRSAFWGFSFGPPRSNPNDLGHSGASVGRETARREGREEGMPLYDCLLLAKNTVNKEEIMGMMTRLGRRVLQRNGVITDIKSFGKVELGYGIKKLDGRHYQGHLMQMTMMVPPSFPKDLQILNNEDRLLRWLVVKHRKTVYGLDSMNEDDGKDELNLFRTGSSKSREDLDDNEEDEDDDEEEYEQE